jgi:trans-aconitate methyltransferase
MVKPAESLPRGAPLLAAEESPGIIHRERGSEDMRQEQLSLVPPAARRVLHLGCGKGDLGAALKARGNVEVIGLESDQAAIAEAQERLDRA